VLSPEEPSGPVLSPGRRLRQLIARPTLLLMPGVFDGFSARLVERFGFEAAFITGGGISESRWGWPDVGLMGLAENLDACRALAGATSIPLLADADTGYGNAVNVHFAVRALEQAGVAGAMFEDQVWPKRCGHMAGKEVIPAAEMVQKIRSAGQARSDPDFVIKARTDAAGTHGIAAAIERGNLYREAGADLLFADALLSEADIGLFCREVQGPVVVNMGFGIRARPTTPLISPGRLEELGVRAAIYPRLLTSAALTGMRRGLAALLETAESGIVSDRPDLCFSFDELNDLMGLREMQALEERYLTPDELARKYGESGAGR
jgi:2-methylisocitrate lyase-like PEP mutase family enzyme